MVTKGSPGPRAYIVALAGAALVLYLWHIRSKRANAGAGPADSTGDGLGGAAAPAGDGSVADSLLEYFQVTVKKVANVFKPTGLRNNNPGNLRFIARNPWRGQVGQDARGYAIYDTDSDGNPVNGVRAIGQQLKLYARRGLTTVRKIVSTWAPASENDTQAYVDDVASKLGVGPDDAINVSASLTALATAIIRHENGVQPFNADDIDTWVNLP